MPKRSPTCEPDVISNEISAAADLMDSCFVDRFTLPLVSWDSAVRKCCAVLTGAGLLRTRGYSPEGDPSVKMALVLVDGLAGQGCGRRPAPDS
jgi:hypothetical protein